MSDENDIKAPDGYLIGGLRKVRKDGTVLFQRGYWQAPLEWAGERVWVHEMHTGSVELEAWPPGVLIWAQGAKTVRIPDADKPDAKPGYRRLDNKKWFSGER